MIAEATEGLPRLVAGDGPLRDLLPETLGFVGPEEVSALYKRAAVVVMASQMEGLPNVILEAMAHGKTVVSTPVGGIPTVIDDGRTGFLVPVGDAAALRSGDRARAGRSRPSPARRAGRPRAGHRVLLLAARDPADARGLRRRTPRRARSARRRPPGDRRSGLMGSTPSRRIAGYDQWRAARFFPGLEGLRAVAALLVVLHHTRGTRLWHVIEGWNGVTLFFVLSGFLITTLGLREEEKHGAVRWRAFFVRRAFRILPIYLVSLALYAAAMVVLGIGAAHAAVFAHAVPWYLSPFPEVPFFTRTHIVFSLAWSIGIEEKFYLLWPLLAFVLLRGRSRPRLGLALGLAFVLQLPIAFTTAGRAVAPYSAILVGCALAFLMHNRRSFARVSRLGSTPGSSALRPCSSRCRRSRTSSTRRRPAGGSPRRTTTSRTRSRRRSSSPRSRSGPGPGACSSPGRCGSSGASATRSTSCTRSRSASPRSRSGPAAFRRRSCISPSASPSPCCWRTGCTASSRSR